MEISKQIKRAAAMIAAAKRMSALSGAGISVESGVPAFRGRQGIWNKYDPMEYASIDGFMADPAKVWRMLAELDATVQAAAPNPAHYALAELENRGKMDLVITQNIDGLHQAAGSRQVAELHGSGRTLSCLSCRKQIERGGIELDRDLPPRCGCGGVLKPDIVFFGEMLPLDAFNQAVEAASSCDLMLVVGTSATVVPASELPIVAKQSGAKVLEINLERSPLSHDISDLTLLGSAGEILQALLAALA